MRGTLWKTLVAILVLCSLVFVLTYPLTFRFADFIPYWTAGHLLVHFQSPYNMSLVVTLERSIGWRGPIAFVDNPPSYLFMTLPFGFLSYFTGSMIWLALSLAALIASVQILARTGNLYLAGYFFPPVICCLSIGQTATFILLGVVLFLRFHHTRPWLAGIGLFLCLMKPHLFVPFGLVVILWAIKRREYRLIGGLVLFAASGLLVFLYDPLFWKQYFAVMHWRMGANVFIPTMNCLFRVGIDQKIVSLEYVPLAVASIWAIWYFLRNREQWDWNRHGMVLLLVSVLIAPYAFFSDETVLLPAILAVLLEEKRSLIPYAVLAAITTAEVILGINLISWWYVWTPIAWLSLYLWASGPKSASRLSQVVDLTN